MHRESSETHRLHRKDGLLSTSCINTLGTGPWTFIALHSIIPAKSHRMLCRTFSCRLRRNLVETRVAFPPSPGSPLLVLPHTLLCHLAVQSDLKQSFVWLPAAQGKSSTMKMHKRSMERFKTFLQRSPYSFPLTV
jgi:hypothetical protein